MKKILVPDYVYTSEKIIRNSAIVIDDESGKILQVAPKSRVFKENKGVETTQLPKHSLLFPGLINSHVHIEFSANRTELAYGDFITWLYSVIDMREELMQSCRQECMQNAIERMLQSGITTFGAISSHGMDLQACAEAKQNVIFFNELIGSQAAAADVLFGDFMQRLEKSKEVGRSGFIPAVAIHSPYSVHPLLIQKAMEVVRKDRLRVTAHFMESIAEREWIDKSEGDFKEFFSKFLNQERAVTSAEEFLTHFRSIPTLFAHGVNMTQSEMQELARCGHSVIHCPISNRLLGNPTLDLAALKSNGVRWMVATDGLSSNYDLDLWEEMKISLFSHPEIPLQQLAAELIDGVTKNPAQALGLQKGEIKEGYDADMIVLQLEKEPTMELALHLILHRYPITHRFIAAKEV